MTDHAEEQEMEAEALSAIFDTHFRQLQETPTMKWSVDIYPEMMAGGDDEDDEENHVACCLVVTLPADYPESLPDVQIDIIKGLGDVHRQELTDLARDEAAANEGVPSIFAVAEKIREWLVENNVKGLDDFSMHAQMMRKKKEEEKAQKARENQQFESQKQEHVMTEAEKEELAVRKRRSEGTPCTMENFMKWKESFEKEMEKGAVSSSGAGGGGVDVAAAAAADGGGGDDRKGPSSKKKAAVAAANKEAVDKSNRLTGREFFIGKINNLEALEAAAEQAGNQPGEDEEDEEDDDDGALEDVDEELFDDDVDLDDLDFDDDDET